MQINLGALRAFTASLALLFLLFARESERKKQGEIRQKEEEEKKEKKSVQYQKKNRISIERIKSISIVSSISKNFSLHFLRSIEFFFFLSFLNRSIFLLSRKENDGEDDFGPIRKLTPVERIVIRGYLSLALRKFLLYPPQHLSYFPSFLLLRPLCASPTVL